VISIRNFITWDLDQGYEQAADPRCQLAIAVAQHVEVLHHGSSRLHSG